MFAFDPFPIKKKSKHSIDRTPKLYLLGIIVTMLSIPQVTNTDQSDGFHYDHHHASESGLPGEITTIESPTYSASLYYPMPGRSTKNGTHSNDKAVAISPTTGHQLDTEFWFIQCLVWIGITV
jgi:hypothetical protein